MAMRKLSMCLDPSRGPPMDVTFIFKKGADVREIKAHKLILSIASDVFNREFYGSMKEPKDNIDIVDASQSRGVSDNDPLHLQQTTYLDEF